MAVLQGTYKLADLASGALPIQGEGRNGKANTGSNQGAPQETAFEDFQRLLAVNVSSVFVATQEALKHMGQGGRIIQIGSSMVQYAAFANSRGPQAEGGRRALFHSGDDAAAKQQVAQLIERLGFHPIDLGSLDGGGRLAEFPGGPLPTLNLVKFG